MTAAPRVTATPGRWQQLRDGIPHEQARAIVAVALFAILGLIGGLAWGQDALNVVGAVAIVWLLFDRANVHERCDDTSDRQDRTDGRVTAIEHHLTGNEPTAGRHADTAPARYKPSPRPRNEEAA